MSTRFKSYLSAVPLGGILAFPFRLAEHPEDISVELVLLFLWVIALAAILWPDQEEQG
jgi:hypothetical protein